jgi:hypothetical protein
MPIVPNCPELINANAPAGRKYLRVPGKWLAKCGKGDADRVFPVIRVDARSDWWTFARVDCDGYEWTVHVPCRGATFQDAPELDTEER